MIANVYIIKDIKDPPGYGKEDDKDVGPFSLFTFFKGLN